jgi:hypothetical protein
VRKMGNIQLREKFPKFSSLYKYGYHNKKAGWVESGKVVNKLLQVFTLTNNTLKFV